MLIHHRALVLIADGKRYLLLRNVGTLTEPELAYEGGAEQSNPATSEQGSDRPGRAYASVGARRSAVAQTDFHQLEEDRFAGEIAAHMGRLAGAGDYAELIVVAPPRTLAELRRCFARPVTDRIVAEMANDLTKHPVPKIAAALAAA